MKINWFRINHTEFTEKIKYCIMYDMITFYSFKNLITYLKIGNKCKDCDLDFTLCGCEDLYKQFNSINLYYEYLAKFTIFNLNLSLINYIHDSLRNILFKGNLSHAQILNIGTFINRLKEKINENKLVQNTS